MRTSIRLGLLISALVVATPATAQLGVEGLGSSITDVSFFATCWRASPQSGIETGACPNLKNGLGVETSFEIGRIRTSRLLGRHRPKSPPTAATDSAAAHPDTAIRLKLTERQIRHGDTVDVYQPKPPQPPAAEGYLTLEFALGYSQFAGFGSSDPGVDLRGAVRELPSATLYGTFTFDTRPPSLRRPLTVIEPYVGLRTGFLQLEGVQAARQPPGGPRPDSAAIFAGSAKSIEVGWMAGLVVDLHQVYLYVDGGYMYRRLPSIQWKSDASKTVPASIPLTLDFSGWSYTIGVQVPVKHKE